MLKFYEVKDDYIQYLKRFDNKVPNVLYDGNNKFVCGIVLQIGEINYYAPVSHFSQKQRTNMLIYNKQGRAISSIRFCFMIPAPMETLTEKKFDKIDEIDSLYADLLKIEYDYCRSHIDDIQSKAASVYKIGCNKNHPFNNTCCNFKILETAYRNYIEQELAICV